MKSVRDILVTPKGMIWRDQWYETIDLLIHDLKGSRLKSVCLFTDGFPVNIVVEDIPRLGFFDKSAFLKRRLDQLSGNHHFKAYGVAPSDHRAFYVTQAPHENLEKLLEKLMEQGIKIEGLLPYVFAAQPMLRNFAEHVLGESVLWVSPMGEQGTRLVFYHKGLVRYVRYLNDRDLKFTAELMKTMAYLEEEFLINRQDLKLLNTSDLIPKDVGASYHWIEQTFPEVQRLRHPETFVMKTFGYRKVFEKVQWGTQKFSQFSGVFSKNGSAWGWGCIGASLLFLIYQGYAVHTLDHEIRYHQSELSALNPQLLKAFQTHPDLGQTLKDFDVKPWAFEIFERLEKASPEMGQFSELFIENANGKPKVKLALKGSDDMGFEEELRQYFTQVTKQPYGEGNTDAFILEP